MAYCCFLEDNDVSESEDCLFFNADTSLKSEVEEYINSDKVVYHQRFEFTNKVLKKYEEYKKNNRIQVKACSVLPDLTSFGPRSEWDRIFFADFL